MNKKNCDNDCKRAVKGLWTSWASLTSQKITITAHRGGTHGFLVQGISQGKLPRWWVTILDYFSTCSVNGTDMSCYTELLNEVLKQQPKYKLGKAALETPKRLAELCQHVLGIVFLFSKHQKVDYVTKEQLQSVRTTVYGRQELQYAWDNGSEGMHIP